MILFSYSRTSRSHFIFLPFPISSSLCLIRSSCTPFRYSFSPCFFFFFVPFSHFSTLSSSEPSLFHSLFLFLLPVFLSTFPLFIFRLPFPLSPSLIPLSSFYSPSFIPPFLFLFPVSYTPPSYPPGERPQISPCPIRTSKSPCLLALPTPNRKPEDK